MDLLAQLSSALGLFGTGLSQHARLITLASAQESALPEALMPERFAGREGVNELYDFDVQALSTSTDLDLDQFIGEEMTVTLLQPDGSRRAWHGLCTEAAWLGADGGVARYRLRLEPALALLRLRRDSYIFQDMTVQDIVTELLSDYPQLRFTFDISQDQPTRTICTQYRESDFEFFTRLLASEGLNWRFEHDQPEESSSDGQARHKLVIFDSAAQAPATPGGDELRFHGVRATDTDDAIDSFSARRRVQANAVTIASWDPAQLLAPAAEQQSNLDAGELPVLAVYDGSGERIASGFDNGAAADPHSRLMLQALELDNKLFEGAGAVRRLAPGHAFTLTQHERYGPGSDAFVALWVEHEARNNFQAQIKTAANADLVENGTYRNHFGCVRDAVAIVPRAAAAAHPVTALGPQTAMVVGLADAVAHTGRDHQVRIQFAWQRGDGANAGGMAHNTDETGNAPGDERSGTWVRVAEALAGPNWGSQFTPRIGTEVLVDFIEGDMDRPVIVAQLYTGADLPPFSAGIDSGANHPGTLSGIHSHNFSGDGYNQWQLDDTQGQVRMRLATSSAATQLNLGYLIQQSPSSAQRGAYRGAGFELRTDAWAIVRGGEGVLLTTSARSAQGAGVTSTQMDASEAMAGFKAAEELAQTISDAATAQNALVSKNAATAHKDFVALLDPEQKGKFSGAVNGQEATKAQSGSRELDASQPVEKFGAPAVVMDSPSSINWATPASTVLFAGQQLRWITQGDVQMTAAHTVSSVAANAASFFTHSGGIQAIAANGPVSLQAHTDQLEIVADKSVTVISVNDSIEIKANQKIVLQAGQSSITLEGGDITFACPGNFTVKGGKHVFDGGGAGSYTKATLPDSRLKLYDEAFILKDSETGALITQQAYRIRRADGTFEQGVTDDNGQTHLVQATEAEEIEIELIPEVSEEITTTKNSGQFDEQIQFLNAKNTALGNVSYILQLEDGSTRTGVTNENGFTSRIVTATPLKITEAKLQPGSDAPACGITCAKAADTLLIPISEVSTNSIGVGTSTVQVNTPESTSRALTPGEIAMAMTIFANSIDYSIVRVHKGEYLWFGLQPDNVAMTPNGEIYFNEALYSDDFSTMEYNKRLWFMHEMVHVWQHQLGYWVKWRGAIRIGLSYNYTLEIGKSLSDYNMEAQGNILADYWAISKLKSPPELIHENKHIYDRSLFESVLRDFIANPGDKNSLPKGWK